MTNKSEYIQRKWEWIYNAILSLRDRIEPLYSSRYLKNLLKYAKKIDEKLIELYGEEHTQYWINDYIGINEKFNKARSLLMKLLIIEKVASKEKYCIACMKSNSCSYCKFAEKLGKCRNENSTYQRFMIQLRRIIHGEDEDILYDYYDKPLPEYFYEIYRFISKNYDDFRELEVKFNDIGTVTIKVGISYKAYIDNSKIVIDEEDRNRRFIVLHEDLIVPLSTFLKGLTMEYDMETAVRKYAKVYKVKQLKSDENR